MIEHILLMLNLIDDKETILVVVSVFAKKKLNIIASGPTKVIVDICNFMYSTWY